MKMLLLGLSAGLFAEEPVIAGRPAEVPSLEEAKGKGDPWLGVRLTKPPGHIYSLLTGIPKGVGFILGPVADGGPAYRAGLRRGDFLWKFEDQLLVNESQMLVLLSHRAGGDKVTLTYQRGGKDFQVEAELMARPESEKGRGVADIQVFSPPDLRISHNLERRSADITDETGTVRIERAGRQFGWEFRDPEGDLVQQGIVPYEGVDGMSEAVDPELEKKLRVLIRALEHAEYRASYPGRKPRIRRVPLVDPNGS